MSNRISEESEAKPSFKVTARINVSDPDLRTADAAVRELFARSLVRRMENSTDVCTAAKTLGELQATGGPEKAGWLQWEDVRDGWDDEDRAEQIDDRIETVHK